VKLFDVYPLLDVEPVKASGCWLWDKNGNKYLDLYGGHAVISIGHCHPHYMKLIEAQLKKIGFYSNSVRIPLQEELAQKLGELSGYTDYNLFLSNSGAEANENALKLASFYNGRKKIISFSKAFHGRTSLAVAATDNKSIVAPVNETDNVLFIPFNDDAALEQAMNETICAVIVEGMQGVGGVNVASDPFLQKAKLLCEKHNAVLILDEVQSGYGRSGKFFSHQYAAIKPDIITTAKGMGNGFPIGGTLISPKFKAKHHVLGTTFGGNHLACAAAIAVLDVIRNEKLIMNAKAIGDYMMAVLKKIHGVKEVRGRGLMIGIELDFPCEQTRNELIFSHKIFTGSSSNKNTLRLLPPLTLSKEEAEIFLHAFAAVMKKSLVK
jgi:acetylornithine aminotransferase